MPTNIAIDLGTSRTRIFVPGKGIIIDQPSVVAVNLINNEILEVGDPAYKMFGKTSDKIDVIFPLSAGVISDFSLVESMIGIFLRRIQKSKIIMPKAVACIPSDITEVEKRATINAIKFSGVRKVYLIEAPVAAAIGSGVEIKRPHGCLVVNVGAGATNIAVISLGGLASSGSLKLAGNQIDEEIHKYLKREYEILIGKRMAQTVKIAIGSVFEQNNNEYFRVKGRNLVTGMPQWVDVSSQELIDVILVVLDRIITEIVNTLERTPPELVTDICNDGIYLSGGSAQIIGFPELLAKRTGLQVHMVKDTETCVVRGAGEAFKYIGKPNNKSLGIINPIIE